MARTRPLRYEGDLAYVPLTQGLEAVVDAADAHLVAANNWYALKSKHTFYAVRKMRLSCGRETIAAMHCVILGPNEKPFVDHADNDGLNNRRANLRPATKLENVVNSRRKASKKAPYIGISQPRGMHRWKAQATVGGRSVYLGSFVLPEDAARAYDAFVLARYGDFARLNFPALARRTG